MRNNNQGTTSLKYHLRDYGKNYCPFPDIESVKEWLIEMKRQGEYLKTLHLSLKKEWYNMIESGIKTEEYREIKPFWCKRLIHDYDESMEEFGAIIFDDKNFKQYDVVKFSYGYTKRTMTFEIENISVGYGNKEWGAPDNIVFIIKLGKRIE